MTHRPNAIIHRPGKLNESGVQRCTRCHMTFGRYTGDCMGWKVGAPIISDRNGRAEITEEEAVNYRPCGRAGKASGTHSAAGKTEDSNGS